MARLRLFILGDPHICPEEQGLWDRVIEDVESVSPDGVLVLGDISGGQGQGSPQALEFALDVLNQLKRPWYSIIGNHDLESHFFKTDEDAVAAWLHQVGRPTPWFTQDFGPLCVIGLSNTQWRSNPGNKNEIVLGQTQIDWWQAELERNAKRPVLILGHAPTIGSGVLTLSEHHCQVGNALMNENHRPGEIQRIIHDNPNVLFWFSGHNHMGQHYRDALTLRQGVHYVHTGVVSRRASRDGQRHSRILDIDEQGIIIHTFDHATRQIDERLNHHEPYSLAEMMTYRQTYQGRKIVPRDPSTMRQGPGDAPPLGATRFAFLSDAHVVEKMGATQQRVLDWALQQVKSHVVDRVVLGGDLTHHDNADHAHGFLNELGITQIPMDYLPGNNEGPDLQIDAEQFANVKMVVGCQEGGEGWPDRTFLLQTTTALDAAQSVRHMLEQWPDQGNVLILAHFPPDLIEGAVEALSDRPEGQQVWWICGHRHQTQAIDQGTLHVRICGGLDPVKIKGQTPCIYLIDWDGSTPVIGHQNVPETILSLPPAGSLQAPIGLAYRDTACGMIETALEHGIAAIQFHASVSKGEPTPHELSVVQRFREQFPDGFLSLHLPNFQVYPEPISLELMEPWLHWAQAIGVNDLTAHLPISAKSSDVFDEQQNWLDTAWVHTCQQTYLALAKRALAMNAMLSLENHYNKTVLSPGEVKLSSYPWHLTHFVCWLRDALSSQGYSQNQIEQIGIIFDVGHAFSDATVAKQHGIADWLNRIGPYFQLSHIHQIVASDQGSRTHHQAITHVLGPLLNYVGVLNAMGDVATKPIPLLIEVRDRQPALASWYTLNMA